MKCEVCGKALKGDSRVCDKCGFDKNGMTFASEEEYFSFLKNEAVIYGIDMLLSKLPANEAKIVSDVMYDGMTVKQAAEKAGIPYEKLTATAVDFMLGFCELECVRGYSRLLEKAKEEGREI